MRNAWVFYLYITFDFSRLVEVSFVINMSVFNWRKVYFLVIFLVSASLGHAQILCRPSQYNLEIGNYTSSSENTPFWLRSNQYGIVPFQSPLQTIRAGIYSEYDSTYSQKQKANSQFALGYGLNIVANRIIKQQPYDKSVLLLEAYVKARLGIFEIYAGRRKEKFGLTDSSLSTGSYAWSGNALPIPKVQIAIPTFVPIGFTRGWVSLQGSFAHGYLDASGFIRNKMLHQKSFYLRLGRPNEVIRVYGGFNHQVVWGGQATDVRGIPGVIPVGGKLPSSLRDYFYVVTAINKKGNTDTTTYTFFDQANRVGNHLGSIDLAIEIDLVRHTLYAYRQSLVEDGSLASLLNIEDGLNGIRLRSNNPNAIVRDFLFELLNTTNQGGPEFVLEDPKKRGKDNYFNHQQYRDGWAYRQHTIGTPFISPAYGPNGEYPYGTFTANNRVIVYHLGIAGNLPIRWRGLDAPISYQAKLSFSQNYGTYDIPFRPKRDQFSGYASIVIPFTALSGFQFTGSVAIDNGALYKSGVGTFLSIQKKIVLF